jgi:hypothetical protein
MSDKQDSLGDWAHSQSQQVNISELNRRTGKDRTTIVKLLERAGVKPRRKFKKETIYDLSEAMAVLGNPGAAVTDPVGIHKARAQKLSVSTARELLKLQQERGELVPIADMREHAYEFVKAMRERCKRYVKEARRTLGLTVEQARQMDSDFDLIFDDLKRDYPEIS